MRDAPSRTEGVRSPYGIGVVIDSERPARWVHSLLNRITQLDRLQLRFVIVDRDADDKRLSPITRLLLNLYGVADARAYPLRSYALDRTPLEDNLRQLVAEVKPESEVDWLIDLRQDADSQRYVGLARNGLLQTRTELVSRGDRNCLDAIRRRSPVASKIELIDNSGRRVVSETIGACHPLSLRHTLDAACRRTEVQLVRTIQKLVEQR